VIAAIVKRTPDAGSSATLDAVDEALAQLYAAGTHSGDLEEVKALWISVAHCRLLDEQGSAHVKRREWIAVEDHEQALSVSVCGELGDFTDERRAWWRVRELLVALQGQQRTWAAEAWYRQVSGPLKPGAQPRGLHEVLGWSHAKTEKTAQRARRTMAAFVKERASGAACRQQGGLLDAFIATSRSAKQAPTLDEQLFERALFHVAGCPDCSAAWRARRRTLAERCSPALVLPLDGLTAAAHATAAKLASVLAGAQNATLSVLGRVGGGAAAAGGSAVTLTGKTAAVCATVVCAATAGGELTGALAPIVSLPTHHHSQQAARKVPRAPAQHASRHLIRPTVAVSYAIRLQRRTAAPPSATAGTSSPPRTSSPPLMPGDIPQASSTPAAAPPGTPSARSAPARRAAVSTRTPPCIPGDLGC
jgi:hypothetical protein